MPFSLCNRLGRDTIRGPFLERPGNLSGSKSNSFNFDPLAVKITPEFQSLKRFIIEDTQGFMSPEKFRDLRETGASSLKRCNSYH